MEESQIGGRIRVMNVALIDCGSPKFGELAGCVGGHGHTAVVVTLDDANQHDFAQSNATIVSGGPHLFTGPNSGALREKFAFLTNLGQPVLGICLGHQALALAAGGEVRRGAERRNGDHIRFAKNQDHPLFRGIEDETWFAEDHCEGASLPEGYVLLGWSEFCANEAMANEESRRYGVQFHPEISGEPGKRLIANFLEVADA